MKAMVLLIAAAFVCAIPAVAQLQMSAAQKEVWAGEQRYCATLMKGDHEGYMALWDESFIGWPISMSAPTTKAGIRQSVQSGDRKGPMQCTSTPLAVNVFGDFANTYYVLRTTRTGPDGKVVATEARITHTWRRKGGKWLIVGGMSARPPQT